MKLYIYIHIYIYLHICLSLSLSLYIYIYIYTYFPGENYGISTLRRWRPWFFYLAVNKLTDKTWDIFP